MCLTTIQGARSKLTENQFIVFSCSGKTAIFKAVVTGEPAPTVSWSRNKGQLTDTEKYKTKYDERYGEHSLEVRRHASYIFDIWQWNANILQCKADLNLDVFVKEEGVNKRVSGLVATWGRCSYTFTNLEFLLHSTVISIVYGNWMLMRSTLRLKHVIALL